MTARFAGSRSLDERRRRRLAAEGEEPNPCGATGAHPGSARDSSLLDRRPTIRIPLQKLVARRGWKVWLIALGAYALSAAIVAAGITVSRWERLLGPGVAALFSGGGGRIARLYSTLLLLSSSQLALLIWWVRSRSPRDFSGQYRIWGWASAVFFLAGCTLITDAHQTWSETVLWIWRTDFRHHAMLAWLTPVALTLGMLFGSLLRDMGDSRVSIAFLCLGAAGGVCASVLAFEAVPLPDPARTNVFRQAALQAAYVSLFSALLLHARYVAYLSADPPQFKQSRLMAVLRRVRLPHWRVWIFRWSKRMPADASAPGSAGSAETDAQTTARKTTRSARAERKAAQRASARSATVENTAETTPRVVESPPEPSVNSAIPQANVLPSVPKPGVSRQEKPHPSMPSSPLEKAGSTGRCEQQPSSENDAESVADQAESGSTQYWIDGPDKSMLKGLSKRERRKLQQEWRERERAARRTANGR